MTRACHWIVVSTLASVALATACLSKTPPCRQLDSHQPQPAAVAAHGFEDAAQSELEAGMAPGLSCQAGSQRKPALRSRYPLGLQHSPMSRVVVERLATVLEASKGRPNVFMKVGDSITISNHFLKCFVEDALELGEYQDLAQTLRLFNQVALGPPRTSFDRASMATCVGWTARDPRWGSPSPLDKEIAGTRPGFAIIMFGTNGSHLNAVTSFERDLLADIDLLLDRGIIPLMSTIPPKLNKPESMAALPEMNAIVRVIAQARQVPLMDYNLALQHLSDFGLADDGVHPRPYLKKYVAHGCWLTPTALQAGMNVRNLVTLTALDRVRRFVLDRQAPEPEPAVLSGDGTALCPYVMDRLPFVDASDTRQGSPAAPQGSGCQAPGDGGGQQIVYQLQLDKTTTVRVRLFSDLDAQLRMYWMNDRSSEPCLASDSTLELAAPAGTHRLVIASPQIQGRARPGSYRLIVVPVD